jgi:hypothetical protein
MLENLIQSKKALLEALNKYYTDLYNYEHYLEDQNNSSSIEEIEKSLNDELSNSEVIINSFLKLESPNNWKAKKMTPKEVKDLYDTGVLGEILAEKAIGQLDFTEDEFIELMQHPGFYIIYS